MTTLTEYLLWKSIKKGQPSEHLKQEPSLSFLQPKKEEVVFPNEMICRVCTNAADIPLSDKIGDRDILSGIRTIANITIGKNGCFPQYICSSCLDELKMALSFKRKSENSDMIFRRQLPPEQLFGDFPIVIHDFALILHEMQERRQYLSRQVPLQSNIPEEIKDVKPFEIEKKELKKEQNYTSPKTSQILKKYVKKKIHLNVKNDKVYKCKRCDIFFDTKELLSNHRKQRKCACQPCDQCGKLVSNLGSHKKIVHIRSKEYTCHVCGKTYYSNGALRSHLLVHTDKCAYSCHLCPYKGKQQAYLTLHMRVHTGERPYLCSECPAKFINPSNLRKHQLVHSNKKFECDKCKRQFRSQKSLKEHFDAAHLNVRYRCSICSRDLWTRRKLLSHELRVHNREKHKLYKELNKIVLNDESEN